MKAPLLLALCVAFTGCASRNVVVAKVEPLHPAKVLPALEPATGPVCFLTGTPQVDHTVIGRAAATKKTYGGSDELPPVAAHYVRSAGGNAVFNWKVEQRVKGPNPWRAVSPTGIGIAVLAPGLNCTELGGLSVP